MKMLIALLSPARLPADDWFFLRCYGSRSESPLFSKSPMATRDDVVEALKTIIDPELFIDIWTLGLIYDILLENDQLKIRMTFTSPACPAGPQLVEEIKEKTEKLEGIAATNVEVVFRPPWEPSEELKAMLGLS